MIIKVIQASRELYESTFTIKCHEKVLGTITVSGHLGSREARILINIEGRTITMQPGKFEKFIQDDKPFRPYLIEENGRLNGGVYLSDSKDGGIFSKYCLYRMRIDEKVYTMYPIGFGEQGAKNPIYLDDCQVCEINIPCITHNDLRVYTLYVDDYKDYISGILFCCSIFVIAHFHPGVKTISGERKVVTIDKNKHLLSKYNPDFVKRIKS